MPDDEYDDIDEEGEEEDVFDQDESPSPGPKKEENYQPNSLKIGKVASH